VIKVGMGVSVGITGGIVGGSVGRVVSVGNGVLVPPHAANKMHTYI
jgi:hypothetical protein